MRNVILFVSLLAVLLVCCAEASRGQAAADPQAQAPASLPDSLQRAGTQQTELNIFYVHGMRINTSKANAGTRSFEVSEPFRKSLCKAIGCSTGKLDGRSYANDGDFAPDAAPPPVVCEEIWKRGSDDWRAAAPFADHHKLVSNSGTTIYVHEINWWPLVFSAKCRQILAKEATLVGLDKKHFETCAAKTVEDSTPNRCCPRPIGFPVTFLLEVNPDE